MPIAIGVPEDSVTPVDNKDLSESRMARPKTSNRHLPRPSQQTARRLSLGVAFAGLAVFVPLVLVSIATVLNTQIDASATASNQTQLLNVAQNYAGAIQNSIEHSVHQVEAIAADPLLFQLLLSNDATRLKREETRLKLQMPSALRVRILSKGIVQPEPTAVPPLTHACLYLAQLAEEGKVPPVDIHGSPTPHIDIVRSIRRPGTNEIAGQLLVTLDLNMLQNVLGKLKTLGYLELKHKVLEQMHVLARSGSPAYRAGVRLSAIAAVPGTSWSVEYWSAPTLTLNTENPLLYWGSFGAGTVVLLLVIYGFYRAIVWRLWLDQNTITLLFKDLGERDLADHYPAHLQNFQKTIEQLHQQAQQQLNANYDAERAKPVARKQRLGVDATPATEELDGLNFSLDALQMEDKTMDEIKVPVNVFRAYDIRGVVDKDLTTALVYQIGRAIGSEAYHRGQEKIAIGRDGRLSGPKLRDALCRGLKESGREVIDVGMVPTPVLYYAAHVLANGSGVMLTGSHNPPEYNGIKMMLQGTTLFGESIQKLKTRIEAGDLISGEGSEQSVDVVANYRARITGDVRLKRKLKIVVDCGNGIAGGVAPMLMRELGCEVIELFCDVDGTFPNHHPDPSKPENIVDLMQAVKAHGADLGVAFDGDGDRLGVIDNEAKVIWPDRVLMVLGKDVLQRNPGAQIIYDVKCTRNLHTYLEGLGGRPLMWKTGHSFIKAKMQETGALLAGEMSGHLFFKERWYGFDDALYACARLLEVLSQGPQTAQQLFAALPDAVNTPELNVAMREGESEPFINALKAKAQFKDAKIIDIDGIRVEFADGWGLVRASNTTPILVLRFEANNAKALQRIKDDFRKQLLAVKPDLKLPF